MDFGKIKINIEEVESKLRIFHKHLGNMLEEFEMVCRNCGSTNTEKTELRYDNQKIKGIKVCKSCKEGEYF